jgi:hypothetical protein
MRNLNRKLMPNHIDATTNGRCTVTKAIDIVVGLSSLKTVATDQMTGTTARPPYLG